ncbi:MAG: hypothetical protein ACO3PX_10930 [bacterium]
MTVHATLDSSEFLLIFVFGSVAKDNSERLMWRFVRHAPMARGSLHLVHRHVMTARRIRAMNCWVRLITVRVCVMSGL